MKLHQTCHRAVPSSITPYCCLRILLHYLLPGCVTFYSLNNLTNGIVKLKFCLQTWHLNCIGLGMFTVGTALFLWLYFDYSCPKICWLVLLETNSSVSLLRRPSLGLSRNLPPWSIAQSSLYPVEIVWKSTLKPRDIRVSLNQGLAI